MKKLYTCPHCGKDTYKQVYKKVKSKDHPWGMTVWGVFYRHTIPEEARSLDSILKAVYGCNLFRQMDYQPLLYKSPAVNTELLLEFVSAAKKNPGS